MCDPYLDEHITYNRLIEEYRRHGNLVVAFDFDNTIYDCHKKGDTYPIVLNLLQKCYDLGLTLVCYTGNDDIELVRYTCYNNGIKEVHYINESPIKEPSRPHKPYFSILLDDRCGLRSAVCDLSKVVDTLQYIKGVPNELDY